MALPPWAGDGTATGTPVKVDVRRPITREVAGGLSIRNTGFTGSLKLAFDEAGVVFATTLEPGEPINMTQVLVEFFHVKSTGGAVGYEWFARNRENN